MQCSNETKITTKVLTVNDAIMKNKIEQEDKMNAIDKRMCKIEEDIINMLRKLDQILATINNKMY